MNFINATSNDIGAISYGNSSTIDTQQVVVTPGDKIMSESVNLRGHGTHVRDGSLVANVAGVVQRINRLISVRPVSSRYVGQVGDVVVGRVVEVGTKRWKIEINARQYGILMLSSINLSGGVQRRRTMEDQLQMRTILSEGDLISADVHSLSHADGSIALHARSLKYGKLENGHLLRVPPALIKRLKQHFVSLPCGVDTILGSNGYVWLTETFDPVASSGLSAEEANQLRSDAKAGIAAAVERLRSLAATHPITAEGRLKIARVANSIEALKLASTIIAPTSIMAMYDLSMQQNIEPKDMLHPETAAQLVKDTLQRLDRSS